MSEAKRAFSLVWDHFTLVNPRKVQCSLCSQCLSFNKNTSAMLRHLRSRHPSEAWYNTSNPSSGVLAMLPNSSGAHSTFSNSTGALPVFSSSSGTFTTFSHTAAGLSSPLASSSGANPTLSPNSVTAHSSIVFPNRQEDLDDALVSMLIKDCQPFSLVEDEGFSAFVMKLDPDYVLPTKKSLKVRMASQCEAIKESVMSEVERADFISVTSDTWTSTDKNMYVSVTGHLVTEASQLFTFLLGVSRLPENHKAVHLEEARNQLVASWGLHSKVAAFVTETSDNMATKLQKLGVLQLPSFAHVLNQVVKRSMEATTELQEIRSQARTIVAFFKSNPVAKERLTAVQEQLNRPGQKLLLEVESRWNSTFSMLQCLFHQREAVAASLSTLDTDISLLGSADYEVIHQCLGVLDPFHQATGELSSEGRVSASKIIPLVRMLRVILDEKRGTAVHSHPTAAQLSSNLQRALQASCGSVESEPVLALATLLDPRFKVLAFGNPANAQEAVKQLTSECAVLIRVNSDTAHSSPARTSASPVSTPNRHSATWMMETATGGATAVSARLQSERGGAGGIGGLWEMFDSKVGETQSVQSSTADAAVEVQRYLSDTYLHRRENPMHYWERHCKVYPHLFSLARKYLSVPASAVPCHHLFTPAGEVFSKRRSCLSMTTVEQIMLLNEGQV